MAEISYPFNADNANGGTSVVSQTQWQAMAAMWGGDRVDFQLTATTYGDTSLPFYARVVNGRSVEVNAGKAWVGGFYYQNTGLKTVTIASNPSTKPRKDLIVLQADMAKSAVNVTVVKGTASATPLAPQPRRQPGGLWEMPLYEVTAAALDASVTIVGRMPFDTPTPVAFPWNAADGAAALPRGSFIYDMDNNGGDSQYEGFSGRDGYVITRHLGKSKNFTPSLVNGGSVSVREGRWRMVGPNTVWFSAFIQNTSGTDTKLDTGAWTYGLTLPVPANGKTGQIITGHLDNNASNGNKNWPNFMEIVGKVNRGSNSQTMWLYWPSPAGAKGGLDGVSTIPRHAFITFSGVYEAASFKE
ncbi:hypothetical protein ACWDBF_16945 [Streptomyces angustmyceticus]